MQKLTTLIKILILFLLTGCGDTTIKNNQYPDWVDNPGSKVVGKCGTHVKGRIAQEMCAYKNGLAYIAMSKGVSVDVLADTTMRQSSTEKTGHSYAQVQVNVKLDEKNIKINARIIDRWHDKQRDILYVLMKEN